MKYVVAVFIAGLAGLLLAQGAMAHVFIRDQAGSMGAILHITPDDDPIAGRKATLLLDIQDITLDNTSTAVLSVERVGHSESALVPAKIDGALIVTDYVFPSQGVYQLRYDITSQGSVYAFEYITRIARGVADDAPAGQRYASAEGLLIGCGVLLLCLGIVAWNRRGDIVKQSVF